MGRPLWVQAVDSLPSGSQGRGLGSPGVGLWGEGWRGGEDKGRAPENTVPPAWRPLVAHNRASFTCVRVCVCQMRVFVSSTTSPGREAGRRRRRGRGREAERCRTLARKGQPFLFRHTHDANTSRNGSSRCSRGRGIATRHPREEEDRRETLVEDHLQHFCPGLNQPRM